MPAGDGNFLLSFRLDLSQARSELKKFEAEAEAAKKSGAKPPTAPRLTRVPQAGPVRQGTPQSRAIATGQAESFAVSQLRAQGAGLQDPATQKVLAEIRQAGGFGKTGKGGRFGQDEELIALRNKARVATTEIVKSTQDQASVERRLAASADALLAEELKRLGLEKQRTQTTRLAAAQADKTTKLETVKDEPVRAQGDEAKRARRTSEQKRENVEKKRSDAIAREEALIAAEQQQFADLEKQRADATARDSGRIRELDAARQDAFLEGKVLGKGGAEGISPGRLVRQRGFDEDDLDLQRALGREVGLEERRLRELEKTTRVSETVALDEVESEKVEAAKRKTADREATAAKRRRTTNLELNAAQVSELEDFGAGSFSNPGLQREAERSAEELARARREKNVERRRAVELEDFGAGAFKDPVLREEAEKRSSEDLAKSKARKAASVEEAIASDKVDEAVAKRVQAAKEKLAADLKLSSDSAFQARRADEALAAARRKEVDRANREADPAVQRSKSQAELDAARNKAARDIRKAGDLQLQAALVEAKRREKLNKALDKQFIESDPTVQLEEQRADILRSQNVQSRRSARALNTTLQNQLDLNEQLEEENRQRRRGNREANTTIQEEKRRAEVLSERNRLDRRAATEGDPVAIAQRRRIAAIQRSNSLLTAQDQAEFNARREVISAKAATAVAEARNAALLRAEISAEQVADEELIRSKAQVVVAERRLAREVNKEAARIARQQGAGLIETARIRTQGPGQGAGGFFGGGALASLRFGLPSLALFAGGGFLVEGVKDAEELNRQFVTLRAQLDAVGRSDAFGDLRNQILSVARDTGISAATLGEYAIRLQGAFGASEALADSQGNLVEGQALVNAQLESAAQLTRVSGLDQEAILNDLTAASFAFESTGEKIGDVAVRIQDRFGVDVSETLNFLGQIGPVAQEAGFSLEEFAVIAAETQQRSGRGGSALAESYGRVIPAISGATTELAQLAANNESLNNQEFLRAVADSDTRTIFFQLAQNMDSLNKESRDFVINLLGGRREAQAIIPAFRDAEGLLENINDVQENSSGLLDERFEAVADTLAVRFAKLGQEVQQVFLQLLESGLLDLLEGGVEILSLLTGSFGSVLQIVTSINDALGGIPVKLLAAYSALRLIQTTAQAIAGLELFRGLTNFGAGLQGLRSRAAIGATLGPGQLGPVAPGAARGALARNPLTSGAGAVAGALGIGTTAAVAAAGVATADLARRYFDARGDANERLLELFEATDKKTDEEIRRAFNEVNDGDFTSTAVNVFQFATGGKTLDQAEEDALQRNAAQPRIDAIRATIHEIERFNEEELREFIPAVIDGVNIETRRQATEALAEQGINLREIDNLDTSQLVSIAEAFLPKFLEEYAADPENDLLSDFAEALTETDLASGGPLSSFAIRAGNAFINLNTSAERILQEERDLEDNISRSQSQIETTGLTLEAAKAQFEAGIIGFEQLASAQERYVDAVGELVALNPGNQAAVQDYAIASAELNRIISQGLVDNIELSLDFNQLDAANYDPASELETRLSILDEINDPDILRGQLEEIFDLRRQILEDQLENAESAAEIAEIAARGVEFSPDEKEALVRQQLTNLNIEWAEFLRLFEQANTALAGDLTAQLISVLAGTGESTEELEESLEEQRAILQASIFAAASNSGAGEGLQQLQELYAEVDQLLAFVRGEIDELPFGVEVPGGITADSSASAFREEISSRFDLLKALAGDDSVRLAQLAVQQAQEELAIAEGRDEQRQARARLIEANNQLSDAIRDSNASIRAANIAAAGNDPIALAQEGVRLAQEEVAAARGAGEAAAARLEYYQALDDLDNAFEDLIQSEEAIILAQAGNDPVVAANQAVAQARRSLEGAKNSTEFNFAYAEWIGSEQDLADALNDVSTARLELSQAQVAGDPVRAAQVGLELANAAVSQARGDAERLRAQAQQVQAQQALTDAIRDVWNAQNELLQAQANFVGDTVEATRLGLEQAQENLRRAQENLAIGSGGEADLLRAEAELISSQASLRDAQLQDKLDDYEFLFEMEKITKSQLIQYLQSLKQIPDLTEDQLRDIDRRIKQLRDELGQDLQFNLPTELQLPTLYEVRRLGQSVGPNGQQAGYQDNRRVEINLTVADGTSHQQMVEILDQALNPNRVGTSPRRY